MLSFKAVISYQSKSKHVVQTVEEWLKIIIVIVIIMYTNEKASQLPPRRKKLGPLSQFVSVTIILRIGRVLSGSVLPVHLTHLASALCYNGHRGVLSDPNILFVDPVRSRHYVCGSD